MTRTSNTVMPERVRAHYLAAMGVAIYVPRSALPGAMPLRRLPNARLVQPPPGRAPGSEGLKDGGARAGSPGLSAVNQILDAAVARRVDRKEDASVGMPKPVSPPAKDEAETIRFTLNLWRVSGSLLVIDSHEPRRGLPTTALLSNILRAAGQSCDLPACETLHWPILATSSRLSDARDMVIAFLASRIAAQPVRRVWLMGECCFKTCTTGQDRYDELLGKTLTLPWLGAEAIILPSLTEMLERPALKVCTWRALRDAYYAR